MGNIREKVIVITGASSGIGEATALLLAEKGAVVVLGARSQDKLADLASKIIALGGRASYAVTDVTSRHDVENLVDVANAVYGKVDVIINNAGIAPISFLDELHVEDWNSMIDVNIKGVLNGIAAALPIFRRQNFGHVINTSSIAALGVSLGSSVYSATKVAVHAISEGLRQEAGANLRVTLITPGAVNTNLATTISNEQMKANFTSFMTQTGLSPFAIARAIAFAIEQPNEVDVNEIVVRPTAQV